MSKVDKLSILGVRSFDNQRSETIQFYSPLTLIVGYNGSGKTTIIECLKYATTGELPPNSRGGAFIHDPKLCGEKEVLAQVRFSFMSTTQARMVATRNLQLTVKKTTRSQKTLEGSLLMVKEGERTAVSSRVAELDQILPQYLGVSKAILENVVFCHQDESLWPLSEPAVLKKKFDEIFEALKYTKAIENIKQLQKKQKEELAKSEINEKHAKANKERAERAERRRRELSDEIEALRVEREALHEKARAVGVKAEESWTNAARFTEIVEKLKSAREKREWHQSQHDKLLANLKKRDESDDLLRLELEQSEERENAQIKMRNDKTMQYEALQRDIQHARDQQSAKRTDIGRLEQQKAFHEDKIREREATVKRVAQEHSIRGYESDLDDTQIGEFIDRIARSSKDQNARLDRAISEHASAVQKVQDVIVELRERRSTLVGSKGTAKSSIAANDRKISASRAELEHLSVDEATRAILEGNIKELQAKLEAAKQRLASSDNLTAIRDLNKEILALEIDISTSNKELIESTKHAGDLARLEHLQNEIQERLRSLETLRATYGNQLQNLIGHTWDISVLEKDFQSVVEAKKQQVSNAERERDRVARQLERVEDGLKRVRASLLKKHDERNESARIVKEKSQVDPEDFLETLALTQQDRDTLKADVENYTYFREYLEKAIEIISTQHVCRLCRRGFEDEKSAQLVINELKKAISKNNQEKAQQELQQLEEYLPKCREASTDYDTWRRISDNDIPALEEEIKQHEMDREKLLQNLEKHDHTVKDFEEACREAETLSKPVSNVSKYQNEIDSFHEQINSLTSNQNSARQTRSLKELQEQIETLNTERKDKRHMVSKQEADEQLLRDRVSSLKVELSAEEVKLAQADRELEKKSGVAKQITELQNANQVHEDAISDIDKQLPTLGSRMSEETKRLEDVKERNKQTESSLQKSANDLMGKLQTLQRLQKDVQQFIDQGGPSQLARCQREIASFDQDIENYGAEARQVTIKINEIRDEIMEKERNKRIIDDNLHYRQASRELASLDEEIENLAGQNAEADQEHHHRDAERFRREHQELTAQETSKLERMKVKDDQLLELLEEWNTDYKDAAPAYKKAHIQVEITKAAVEDLGRYGSALDKAIMKYHTLKMEEINRIIEELWRRTYQGTDVDTILIRSDNETAKGNRSYNYRVCMVKQDAEMDMRGRCSAGQKVLASIIIRLALAECFGVNCGLIALDEPTTNLDRDNITSLAESLHHIIRQRRQQRNFQLIVITHDEDFLRAIKPAEFCDYYYRVSRNDRQKSIIERQSIAEVL